MARFVDLDEEEGGQAEQPSDPGKLMPLLFSQRGSVTDKSQQQQQHDSSSSSAAAAETGEHSLPATVHNAVTEAFQCYPIVVAIVSRIDLNSLDALSRTSRLIHDGLIQYRTSLLAATLRCSNERMPVDPDETLRYRARASNWHYMEDGRSYSGGKSGSCARDMVGECRRCAEVICRNCAIKPPAPAALRERHRRLCITCSRAPIATLASPPLDASLPLDSDAAQRAVCKCDTEGVWLCQPCGRSIRNADHEYKRIWRWRNQYGEVLGGLGTGIGDGDRGVICGREEACLAAREREHEIDCDAEDARGTTATPWSSSFSDHTPGSPGSHHTATPPAVTVTGVNGGFPFFTTTANNNHNGGGGGGTIESLIDEMRRQRTPSPQLGPGYARHEIEGIGGIVKRKLVRMVRVGACVPEWEDERGGMAGGGGKVLAREINGSARSWCGWCWRVIPGNMEKLDGASLEAVDRRRYGKRNGSVRSSSSSSSSS